MVCAWVYAEDRAMRGFGFGLDGWTGEMWCWLLHGTTFFLSWREMGGGGRNTRTGTWSCFEEGTGLRERESEREREREIDDYDLIVRFEIDRSPAVGG